MLGDRLWFGPWIGDPTNKIRVTSKRPPERMKFDLPTTEIPWNLSQLPQRLATVFFFSCPSVNDRKVLEKNRSGNCIFGYWQLSYGFSSFCDGVVLVAKGGIDHTEHRQSPGESRLLAGKTLYLDSSLLKRQPGNGTISAFSGREPFAP